MTGGKPRIGRAVCAYSLPGRAAMWWSNYCHGEAAAAETVSLCRAEGAQAVAVQADVSTVGCKKLLRKR